MAAEEDLQSNEYGFRLSDLQIWLEDHTVKSHNSRIDDEVAVDGLFRRIPPSIINGLCKNDLALHRKVCLILGTKIRYVKRKTGNFTTFQNICYRNSPLHQDINAIMARWATRKTDEGLELVRLCKSRRGLVVLMDEEKQIKSVKANETTVPLNCGAGINTELHLRRLLYVNVCSSMTSGICSILQHESVRSDICTHCSLLKSQRSFDSRKASAKEGEQQMLQKLEDIGGPFADHVKAQLKISEKKGIVYDEGTITTFLRFAVKDPKAYDDMRQSGSFGVLPCRRTLTRYKNSARPICGINNDILNWMKLVWSDRPNTTGYSWAGGLLIDEMYIQEDIQFDRKGEAHGYAMGSTMRGEAEMLFGQPTKPVAANKVVQLLFCGLDGRTFPFAHWPEKNWTSWDILSTITEAIEALYENGFTVKYVSMDGAATNRSAIEKALSIPNALYPDSNPDGKTVYTFISDIKHCIKKLRNSLLLSRIWTESQIEEALKKQPNKKVFRTIELQKGRILWSHWIRAFQFGSDRNWMINPKLTKSHIFVGQMDKMRNHLAEEVLDKKMLYLMKEYAKTTEEDLSSTIALLEQTSELIEIFTNGRYKHCDAEIMARLLSVSKFFTNWEEENGFNYNKLPTKECLQDMDCCLAGFRELVKFAGFSIQPGFINSDLIELHFSKVRGMFYNRTPNAVQYTNIQNNIIIGQPCATGSGFIPPYSVAAKKFKKIE